MRPAAVECTPDHRVGACLDRSADAATRGCRCARRALASPPIREALRCASCSLRGERSVSSRWLSVPGSRRPRNSACGPVALHPSPPPVALTSRWIKDRRHRHRLGSRCEGELREVSEASSIATSSSSPPRRPRWRKRCARLGQGRARGNSGAVLAPSPTGGPAPTRARGPKETVGVRALPLSTRSPTPAIGVWTWVDLPPSPSRRACFAGRPAEGSLAEAFARPNLARTAYLTGSSLRRTSAHTTGSGLRLAVRPASRFPSARAMGGAGSGRDVRAGPRPWRRS